MYIKTKPYCLIPNFCKFIRQKVVLICTATLKELKLNKARPKLFTKYMNIERTNETLTINIHLYLNSKLSLFESTNAHTHSHSCVMV